MTGRIISLRCGSCGYLCEHKSEDIASVIPFDDMIEVLERCDYKVYTKEENDKIEQVRNYIEAYQTMKKVAEEAGITVEESLAILSEIRTILK